MTITTRRVVGPIVLPDGSVPRNGRVTYQLSGWDREGVEAVMTGPITVQLDSDAVFDDYLWCTNTGKNGRVYLGVVAWHDGTARRELPIRFDVQSGVGTQPFVPSWVVGDLPESTQADALAQCLAAATQTAADRVVTTSDRIAAAASAAAAATFNPANYQPKNATLTSLSALGKSAGKFAYTTGADTWADATITSAGRALLDDANAAAQRTTLGLGTVTAIAEAVTDLNAITRSGWNRFAAAQTANIPFATGVGMVLTIFYDGSAAVQLVWGHNKGESDTGQWIRWRAASAWGGWVRLYGSDSEIKTDVLNASGNAPTFACRAWVNFNGTGTPAIRRAGNVSSITDNGVGDYTVNFTTAMPDANYSAIGTCGHTTSGGFVRIADGIDLTVGGVRVQSNNNTGTFPMDCKQILVAIFR